MSSQVKDLHGGSPRRFRGLFRSGPRRRWCCEPRSSLTPGVILPQCQTALSRPPSPAAVKVRAERWPPRLGWGPAVCRPSVLTFGGGGHCAITEVQCSAEPRQGPAAVLGCGGGVGGRRAPEPEVQVGSPHQHLLLDLPAPWLQSVVLVLPRALSLQSSMSDSPLGAGC